MCLRFLWRVIDTPDRPSHYGIMSNRIIIFHYLESQTLQRTALGSVFNCRLNWIWPTRMSLELLLPDPISKGWEGKEERERRGKLHTLRLTTFIKRILIDWLTDWMNGEERKTADSEILYGEKSGLIDDGYRHSNEILHSAEGLLIRLKIRVVNLQK